MLLFVGPCSIVPKEPKYRGWSNPASFPMFSLLPAEIRIAIWEYIYQQPRDVLIKYGKLTTTPDISALIFNSRTPVPALFHVCSESRAIGLKKYRTFPAFYKPMTRSPYPLAPQAPRDEHPRGLVGRFWKLRSCRPRHPADRRQSRDDAERMLMPIYYSKTDTVFIMPRTRADEPTLNNLRNLTLDEVSDSAWGLRYSVLYSLRIEHTLRGYNCDNPDIELALSWAMPGIRVLFPLVHPDD